MAAFCLPPDIAEQLKKAAMAGEIDIAKMFEMSSAERRGIFEKYVDANTAKSVNGEFEKAMISTQKNALKKWAEKTFTPQEKKTGRYTDVLTKINDLDKLGVLNPEGENGFLEDLVASKLGATVTAEEAKQIGELSKTIESTATGKSEFGTPTLEYFKARKAMDDYIDSLTPSSKLKVASSIIARGTMLASIKSPLLNIESNTVNGLLQSFTRRVESRSLGGKNNDFAIKYIKFVNKVYKQTGYDLSRMMTLESDKSIRGENVTTTQGPGTVRKVGQIYEDIIFKNMQGQPDVVYSSLAFADRANIESTKVAKGNKDKALEIFKDATSITPQTPEGQAVRESAIADALYSTYTNKSIYSEAGLGIRQVFNKASGDLRLGDQIMPFVKTPANVIGTGIDASGILIAPKMAFRILKTVQDIKSGEPVKESAKNNFQGFAAEVIRAGLGLSMAYILSTLFKPDDYIGEYPTTEKERRLLELKNAATNSLRIGGKWVSLDYFGALGAPLVGLMYAKKYGKDLPTSVWEYYKGVARQAAKIPGFDEFYNTIDSLKQSAPGAGKKLNDEIRDVASFGISFIRSRTIPAFVSDIAKGTDTKERKVDRNDLTGGIKSGIPGLRQSLPVKKNVFGEDINTEGIVSVLFAGARVKSVKDNAVISELTRLASTGNLPSITDIEKTSPRAQDLKAQIGDEKFQRAKQQYTQALQQNISRLITTNSYKHAKDDEKQKQIDTLKDKEFDTMLKRSGYRKPKK